MATTDPYADLAKEYNSIRSGRLGGTVGAPGSGLPAPVQDVMTKAGNALEVPFDVFGANQMDYLRARRSGATPTQAAAYAARALYGGMNPHMANTAAQHVLNLINQGKLSEAADLYSITSINANKQRAAMGDRLAGWFQHHPSIFGATAVPEEIFANPANAAVGDLTKALASGLARTPLTLTRFKAASDAARTAAEARKLAPQVEEARRAANEARRVDKLGEDVPGSVKGFVKDPAARERAEHAFKMKQQQTAAEQAARERAAKAPKLTGAPGPTTPILSPGQRLMQALPPPENVAAQAGEARLALPPPSEAAVEAHMPAPHETYADFIARRGGKDMTPEEWQTANADWQKTWPEGTKPPVVNKEHLVSQLRAIHDEPKMAAGPRVTARIERPGVSAVGPADELTKELRPGAETATRPTAGIPMEYDPNQPIMAKGPKPPQGPFRYDLPPDEVADQVEQGLRHLADQKDVRSEAQALVHDLWGGMTKEQQQTYVHMHERTLPLPEIGRKPGTPLQELRRAALRKLGIGNPENLNDFMDLAERQARRIAKQRQTSKELLKYEVAEPGQLRLADTFLSRLGSMDDAEDQALESEAINAAPHEFFTQAVRKGTLAHERTSQTYFEALNSGRPVNTEWEPAVTDEMYWLSRLESIKINKLMQKFRELGVVTYPGEARPFGWLSVKDTPAYAETPSLEHFGSKILNEGYFPPAIAKALGDITIRETSLRPEELLPTPYTWLGKAGSYGNWLAERWQTASPVYHPPANVYPSQIATLIANAKNPWDVLKGLGVYHANLITGKGTRAALDAGAASPYSSNIPASRMIRPWSDLKTLAPLPDIPPGILSPKQLRALGYQRSYIGRLLNGERWRRISDLAGRGIENITSRPLYQHAEPRMAGAHFAARQAQGASPARAMIETRATIGEPENLPASARNWAQAFMFPTWRAAMIRLWGNLLGKTPGLYTGPQRFARAYNISRGAYNADTGDQPPLTQSQRLFPYLLWKHDAKGNPIYFSFPAPANLMLGMVNAAGNPFLKNPSMDTGSRLASLFTTFMNPWIATGTRAGLTWAKPAGFAGTGAGGYRVIDKDEPQAFPGQHLLQAIGATAKGYAPLPVDASGLSNLAWWRAMQIQSGKTRTREMHMEARMRHRIHKMRQDAVKEQNKNTPAGAAAADKLNKDAAAEYWKMVKKLTDKGLMPQP